MREYLGVWSALLDSMVEELGVWCLYYCYYFEFFSCLLHFFAYSLGNRARMVICGE